MLRAGRALLVHAALLAPLLTRAAEFTGDLPHYTLRIELDPASHELFVDASIALPARLAGEPVEFLLAEDLALEYSEPRAERMPAAGAVGFMGINGSSAALTAAGKAARYRIAVPHATARDAKPRLALRYRGPVNAPLLTPPEESARSFSETTGLIDERGVYLAGSSLWYPYLGDQLFTFELRARAPQGWHLISPGDGTSRDEAGVARWASPLPVDELHVVGGPLVRYATAAGAAEALVYLRTPDDALAARYLEATARDLEMYRGLIGPYPYGKFALVENFWETGYGMPSFTLLGQQVIRFPFILTSSYPHEILHNWWGNSVFVDYATGNWCEGLTAYLADHLFKEQQGQGAEYRRDTLKRYRDYVRVERDFPLREFRSRHSAATEAVGYGKTLMGFHMLRRQLGEETFRRALSSFYRAHRGRRAGFEDLRAQLEKVSARPLDVFFEQWVMRAGAPDLRVQNVRVHADEKGHRVSGELRQVQDRPWTLEVPVVVRTQRGETQHRVTLNSAQAKFELRTDAQPLLLEVDPEFDVFRLLDARETAPSLGQLFGEPAVLGVLPARASPAQRDAYRKLLESWSSAAQRIEIVLDREVRELPADRGVWLMGRDNSHASRYFGSDPRIGLSMTDTGIATPAGSMAFAGASAVVALRHPANPAKAIGWITVDPLAAAPGLARKLPHYGKYSYLGFSGDEPVNTVKGEWAAGDSPLRVDLRPAEQRAAALPATARPAREPLALPPAAFSQEKLMEHVRWLAAPERQGRGLGTRGIEEAAAYVARQFAGMKLEPAFESYRQAFQAVPDEGRPAVRTENIVGYVRGANAAFAGQAVLVSAHYDHLGTDGRGVRAEEKGRVHPGADDNASGVAVLLELAQAIAAGQPPPRTIVFAAFSAEESGLAGSRYFAEHPAPMKLDGLRAVVNLDTVGRLEGEEIRVLATDTATEWPHIVRGVGFTTGIRMRSIASAAGGSDQQSFIDKGIPGVQIFSGANLDYHRPSDTADRIDAKGLVAVATAVKEIVGYLAERADPLTATIPGAAGEGPAPGSAARRVSFGLVPDFAFQDPGVRAESVVPGSPAEGAGVRAGDVVLALDDRPIGSLGDFSEALKALQPGDRVRALLLRDGARVTLEIAVTAR